MGKDKVRVKLNLKGLNELMKSEPVQERVLEAGQAVAAAAGDGYEAEVHNTANWLAISNVYPNTKEAAKDNYENHSLIKAIDTVGLYWGKAPMSRTKPAKISQTLRQSKGRSGSRGSRGPGHGSSGKF